MYRLFCDYSHFYVRLPLATDTMLLSHLMELLVNHFHFFIICHVLIILRDNNNSNVNNNSK